MIINVHAGHNADGKVACGAVGLISESTEARKVKNSLITLLQSMGHTVYDCTVDSASNQQNNLSGIVKKCNAHTVDIDISIHFNSGANDKTGNGVTTGVEALLYDNKNALGNRIAKDICANIEKLGYKNRGIKLRPELYVLAKTKAPAILVECCFVDDKDDVAKYNYAAMAKAIANAINSGASGTVTQKAASSGRKYTVKKGDSLWTIASAQLGSGSRYSEIMALNGLTSSKLTVGQVLKLPEK